MRVLIQLRHSPSVHAASLAMTVAPTAALEVPGVIVDSAYAPVQVPTPISPALGVPTFGVRRVEEFTFEPPASTYLVRGQIPDEEVAQRAALGQAGEHPDVVGIFSDPVIAHTAVYCGNAAVGSAADVAASLGVSELAAAGMDGKNVSLAVVDTGINLAYLRALGRHPHFSPTYSWAPSSAATAPGSHPVDHGTMCAFDAGIAAPNARLLDYAVLLAPNTISGLLSDAVVAYGKLLQLMTGSRKPRALVVSNSWGLFDPATDFPVGHPGNYSDNPSHPFNIIVGSLDAAGADVLFAAGNCGRDCPDDRCRFTSRPICGANSHPQVLSVAGIDVQRRRVGYSSQGPGRLSSQKPDLSSYTHFAGSGVFGAEPDSGTSAACPVAAGVVAAIRTKHSTSSVSPGELRNLIFKSADDLGGMAWDADFGWGAIDPVALVGLLA
ncbi:MAG: S8 family serine peptidase [Actinomycetota bacterium]